MKKNKTMKKKEKFLIAKDLDAQGIEKTRIARLLGVSTVTIGRWVKYDTYEAYCAYRKEYDLARLAKHNQKPEPSQVIEHEAMTEYGSIMTELTRIYDLLVKIESEGKRRFFNF
jgi:IS30 family transposase